MSDFSKQKLALVCTTVMAMTMTACGDDSTETPQPNCGEYMCTENQECIEGECKDIVTEPDPCDLCTENQECIEGECKDIVTEPDPCDLCTDTQTCIEGECKDLCGTEVCSETQICDPESQTCIDPPPEDPCAKCTESEMCVDQTCVPNPCYNKTCPDNYRCDSTKNGECVEIDPCENVTCNDAQTCIKGECIDDNCIVNGAEKYCGEGRTCVKGECIDDGCQNVVCDEDWVCSKGVCIELVCLDYYCAEGRSCKGGECHDNECLDIVCDEGMVCSKGNCTYNACLNKAPCTIGKMCNVEGSCIFIEPPAISIDEPEDKITDELGKSITLALRLNNQPTKEVRVSCEIVSESPNPEATFSCDEIVFNEDNWQLEQSIVLKGIEDYLKDGDQTYKLKVTTTSEDPDFAELITESVDLTNLDRTVAGIKLSETTLTTYEDQSQEPAKFTIVLTSIPKADVSISYSSSNHEEGTVSPNSVTFTKENWNIPQTVTVKGVDDFVKGENQPYTIFFAPTDSEDPDYQELSLSPIKVTHIDNDIAALNINIPAEDFVLKEKQNYPVAIKLTTQPKKDVKVTFTVDDDTEARFNVNEITINAETWNDGGDVYLTGLTDDFIDGDQPIKLNFATTSDDPDYNELTAEFNGTVKDTDTADIVAFLGDSAIVKEGDPTFMTMSLTLASQPTQEVNIALSVSDASELKINKTTLKFSPERWDIPQDILVNSVDDELVDGNIKSKIIMKSTSSDANFNGTKEVEFTTVDNDVAAFVISSNTASFPENSGATTSMKINLKSQPAADVTVNVSSSDASELTVTSSNTLTFTTANWKTPQSVSVKVIDDKLADSTQTAFVKFVASSTDKNYNGITGQSATYTIIDNDAPSLSLTSQSQTIGLGAPTTTASVVLGVQPTSDVTVNFVPSDAKLLNISPSRLTFTSSNWDKPQNVSVTAQFNAIAAASATATLTAKATAGNSYNNATSNTISLNLVKVPEVQNFTFTRNVQTATLPQGRYKLEVWGAQGGGGPGYPGAKGGYSTGILTLNATTTVYIYVGGQGEANTGYEWSMAKGGWNGGGAARMIDYTGGSGGGATDIALVNSAMTLDSTNRYVRSNESYLSRIIVAGGGGGSNGEEGYYYEGDVSVEFAYGGGTSGGGNALYSRGVLAEATDENNVTNGGPGTQTTAGNAELYYDDYEYYLANPTTSSAPGAFGIGGTYYSSIDWNTHAGGGGGGWYGGGVNCHGNGGGGSGYIYTSSTASNYPAGCRLNSNYYLTNAQTIAGNATMPAPAGSTETGHTGNGYARITLVK